MFLKIIFLKNILKYCTSRVLDDVDITCEIPVRLGIWNSNGPKENYFVISLR
jgi:hypothetical protein